MFKDTAQSLKKYSIILYFAARDATAYPVKVLADLFSTVVRVSIALLVYAFVFEQRPVVGGMDFTSLMWSIGSYFMLLSLSIRYLLKAFSEDIRFGQVEQKLNKPYSYVWYMICNHLGGSMAVALISFVVLAILLTAFAGLPIAQLSWFHFILFVILFLLGVVVSCFLYTIIGLLAFWLEDAESLYWFSDKLVVVLGGGWVPVYLLPEWLQQLALFTPFGACMFVTHVFAPNVSEQYLWLILMQIFWIFALGTVVWFLFQKARRRVSVNGG